MPRTRVRSTVHGVLGFITRRCCPNKRARNFVDVPAGFAVISGRHPSASHRQTSTRLLAFHPNVLQQSPHLYWQQSRPPRRRVSSPSLPRVSWANGDAISRLGRPEGPQSSAAGAEGHGALPLVVATCAMAAATSKMRAAPTAAAERARGDHCRAQRPLLGSVGAHTPPQHHPVPASEVVPPRTLCYARGNARTRSEVFIPCMCRRL